MPFAEALGSLAGINKLEITPVKGSGAWMFAEAVPLGSRTELCPPPAVRSLPALSRQHGTHYGDDRPG